MNTITTMEGVTVHTEKDIVFDLINDTYDLTQLDNGFIVYCEVLLEIQIYVYNEMLKGNDMTGDVGYSDGTEFKSSEQDMLFCANSAKIINPILRKVKEEISHRDIDHCAMHANALLTYAKIHGIIMINNPLL